MQLRQLVLGSFLLSCSLVTRAQQGSSSRAFKQQRTDSASTGSYLTPKGTLLASNLPVNPVTGALERQPYATIPLAGEKNYYGDKTDFVNNFVRKYLETNSKTLSCVQNNSATPFSVIDDVLSEKNMPKELKYLAVIESALNHRAVSPAGAVGPWQLMETTARMMGLSVTKKSDERTDWRKSTAAATKYLEMLYGDLNDWLLVVAAYNSGPTPVLKAIEKTGSRSFWDIKQYLPQETQGHVLAFIATATIFENLSKYIGLGSVPVDFRFTKEKDKDDELFNKEPVAKKPTLAAAIASNSDGKLAFSPEELKSMAIIKIDQPVSLDLLERECGIDKKLMVRWNPDYDLFMTNKYGAPFYKIKLPKDKIDVFLQKKSMLMMLTRK